MVELLPFPSHHTSLRSGQIPVLIGSLNDGIIISTAQAKMQGPLTTHSTKIAALCLLKRPTFAAEPHSSEECVFRWTA
jgi:hypothetical protein